MNKRILFLTSGSRVRASARYRALQFLPYLAERGFETYVLPPSPKPKSNLQRIFDRKKEEKEILLQAEGADIVFVQKRLFHTGLLKKLKALGCMLIYDFDDNITTTHDKHWSRFTEWKIRQRFRTTCRLSDIVIAGNNYLAGKAAMYADRVEILPTVVEYSRYRAKEHKQNAAVVLGWIGQPSTLGYIEALSPILAEICGLHPELRLRVISKGAACLPGVNSEFIEWNESKEVDDLLGMDIGLMPLPDDEWVKGKCALKAIQYMAAGLPVVCSRVGANSDVVRHDVDGYLVTDDKSDWFQALNKLISDSSLRARMGGSGRQRVSDSYSLEYAANSLADWICEPKI